jgi:hypothetical protein
MGLISLLGSAFFLPKIWNALFSYVYRGCGHVAACNLTYRSFFIIGSNFQALLIKQELINVHKDYSVFVLVAFYRVFGDYKLTYRSIIQSKHIIAPNILPSITIAETYFLAFDIVSNDFRIGLYGWLHFSVYFRVQFAVHFLVYFVVQFLVNLVLYSTYPLLCTMYKRLWNVCKISQSQFF